MTADCAGGSSRASRLVMYRLSETGLVRELTFGVCRKPPGRAHQSMEEWWARWDLPARRNSPAPSSCISQGEACSDGTRHSARRHHVGVNAAARDRGFPDPVAVIAGDHDRISLSIEPVMIPTWPPPRRAPSPRWRRPAGRIRAGRNGRTNAPCRSRYRENRNAAKPGS